MPARPPGSHPRKRGPVVDHRSRPRRTARPHRPPLPGARLHFYAGLLVGPFLLIAALTGGLYPVAPSIESRMYRDQLHTANRGPALPLADQVRAAQDARPDLVVSVVRPAERRRTPPG